MRGKAKISETEDGREPVTCSRHPGQSPITYQNPAGQDVQDNDARMPSADFDGSTDCVSAIAAIRRATTDSPVLFALLPC